MLCPPENKMLHKTNKNEQKRKLKKEKFKKKLEIFH